MRTIARGASGLERGTSHPGLACCKRSTGGTRHWRVLLSLKEEGCSSSCPRRCQARSAPLDLRAPQRYRVARVAGLIRTCWRQARLRLADVTHNDRKGAINMYAVMGITGKVGGAVASALLAKGEKVRGIVRNPEKAAEWQKQGVELFKADYDDVDALTSAFTGVAGAFVMVPPNFAPTPGFAETKATLKVLHEALSRALPPKAVYLSSIGAEQARGLGLITR